MIRVKSSISRERKNRVDDTAVPSGLIEEPENAKAVQVVPIFFVEVWSR
jgi:hypothetical protein